VFEAYAQIGTPEVVLKRGAEACLIRCDGEAFEVPAQKVEKVVDTTAAGDSFSAAYLAAAAGWQSGGGGAGWALAGESGDSGAGSADPQIMAQARGAPLPQ
jgi:2-dehydro-3-deoxygluconokinase